METTLAEAWTPDRFLAWEDAQEGKHEFDGRTVIPTTDGAVAHQQIVFNLCLALMNRLAGRPIRPLHGMRLQTALTIRYPDVVICPADIDQTISTLADAVAIFEVLSPDTATTDRVSKLIEYANVPSLRCCVLLEQTTAAATLFERQPAGTWRATPVVEGEIRLPGLDIALSLTELYRGLTFPSAQPERPA